MLTYTFLPSGHIPDGYNFYVYNVNFDNGGSYSRQEHTRRGHIVSVSLNQVGASYAGKHPRWRSLSLFSGASSLFQFFGSP